MSISLLFLLTHTRTHALTHAHTHTQWHSHTNTSVCVWENEWVHILSHTYTPLSLSLSHTFSHTLTHIHSPTHTHTHTLSLTYTISTNVQIPVQSLGGRPQETQWALWCWYWPHTCSTQCGSSCPWPQCESSRPPPASAWWAAGTRSSAEQISCTQQHAGKHASKQEPDLTLDQLSYTPTQNHWIPPTPHPHSYTHTLCASTAWKEARFMTYIAPCGWKSPTGIRTHNDRDVHPCTYLSCADVNAWNGMWHAIASGGCRNTIKSLHSALKTDSVRKRNAITESNLWEQCIRPDPTFLPTPSSSPIKMLCQTHLWKSSMQCIWLVASTVKGIPSSDLPQTTHVKQSGWYGLPVALSSWQKTWHQ